MGGDRMRRRLLGMYLRKCECEAIQSETSEGLNKIRCASIACSVCRTDGGLRNDPDRSQILHRSYTGWPPKSLTFVLGGHTWEVLQVQSWGTSSQTFLEL